MHLGKTGHGRPVRTCTIGAIVSRICEILRASSGFLSEIDIFFTSRRCIMPNFGLFALLILFLSLILLAGIRFDGFRFPYLGMRVDAAWRIQ